MRIADKIFEDGARPYIMGILNVTPDSFSDGGTHNDVDAALKWTEKLINDGADIIDVGGESTRPGYTLISDEEEIGRVVPVIEGIKKNFDITVSLDTYKSGVAEAGIKAGADMINDIWGLKWDANMAAVIAKYNSSVCIMHNRKEMDYTDFVEDVMADLAESIKLAKEAGIPDDRIMIDPGIGFAKDLNQNLLMMKNLGRLKEFGYPILLGTSRKSMIGLTLDLPKDQREEGTVATSVYGRMIGCDYFRVHDVQANFRALKMTEAMLKAE